ncbi:MAG: TetR/AcrR family transcriptional regulator [Candidatus Binatia bacterium]
MPRPRQRTPELKDRLLQAAVAALVEEGVAGFTTRRVANDAGTSVPAVYELFGSRAGLVRELFFEGFRRLRARFDVLQESGDPRADLLAAMQATRGFLVENRALAEVLFSRPFTDFDPGPDDVTAGDATREFIVDRVRRCTRAGLLVGDEVDIAHVLFALVHGLAARETAGWLGKSASEVERRWDLALRAVLDGVAAKPEGRARPTRPPPAIP